MIPVLDARRKKCGVVDASGRVAVPFEYEDISYDAECGNGVFSVCKNELWGAVDCTGRIILDFAFKSLSAFNAAGVAVFGKDELQGLIHTSGRVVLGPRFASISNHLDGLYQGYNYCCHTLFNLGGTFKFEKRTHWFSVGDDLHRMAFYDDEAGKYGYCSMYEKEGIPPLFDEAELFSNGWARVRVDGKFTFVDRAGRRVPTVANSSLRGFSEGLAPFEIDGKWGFLCAPDTVAIPPRYDDVAFFSSGVCPVKIDGGYEYIDRTGVRALPLRLAVCPGRFSKNGMACVVIDEDATVIDRQGRVVWKAE